MYKKTRKKFFKATLVAALAYAALAVTGLIPGGAAYLNEALAAPPVFVPPPVNIPTIPQVNTGQSSSEMPTHLDPTKNPGGCSACHASGGGQKTCFSCHGPNRTGLKGASMTDIYSLRLKTSRHPMWSTGGLFSRYNQKPALNPLSPRHVGCLDCHNPHEETAAEPTKGAMGYSAMRTMDIATQEYEICFRCHSDSVNKPVNTENLREVFSPANPSYHPVELAGKNTWVPSLKPGYTVASTIMCTDCHGNDDSSGPQGPHASDYAPILVKQYVMQDGPESPYEYALCYKCHDRNSILGDQSFKAHKFHIVYDQDSCHDCHSAHGSQTNSFLISFDKTIITNGSSGGPLMLANQQGKPYCYLSCHGADHNMLNITSATVTQKWPW